VGRWRCTRHGREEIDLLEVRDDTVAEGGKTDFLPGFSFLSLIRRGSITGLWLREEERMQARVGPAEERGRKGMGRIQPKTREENLINFLI
jgi:hypothetical protein